MAFEDKMQALLEDYTENSSEKRKYLSFLADVCRELSKQHNDPVAGELAKIANESSNLATQIYWASRGRIWHPPIASKRKTNL